MIIILCLACGAITSCASDGGIPIPGENEITLENITAEYFSIAKGYADIKNYTKAAEYYKKAMSSKKLHDAAYYEMGRCYALAKDWGNAEQVFLNLQKKDPENTNIQISLAYIKAMSGKTSEALALYRMLMEKNPTNASLLINYIAVLMADGKYEIAEQQYYVLKKKFPDEKAIPDILAKLADNLENTENIEKEGAAKAGAADTSTPENN